MSFWGPVVAAGIGGLGSLVGGAMSSAGAADRNASSLAMAREQMNFSAQQAQRQMDFQERMSNTQYQRGMADMKSAGLNPILAYSQGGASSPMGAAGQSAGANFENTMEGYGQGVASAGQAASRSVELRKVLADTANTNSMEKLNSENAELSKAKTAESNQATATSAQQAQKAAAETANIIASADNPAAMRKQMEASAAQSHSAAALNTATTKQLVEHGPGRIGQESSGVIKLLEHVAKRYQGSFVRPVGERTTTPTFFGGQRPKFFWEK